MKAAIINQYGSSHELQVADVPKPEVDTHDVLIRIEAAGVNPYDIHIREGDMKLLSPSDFPRILGGECAGVVEAVGLMITDVQVGDRVVASLGVKGVAYAEYVATDAKNVAKIPDGVETKQAAGMPVAAGTALQGMRDKGHLRPADRVLINGAAGGVGTFAVQIAKLLGAHVTAVCSAENAALVAELGADIVIDHNTTDFTKSTETYNLVFDAVGKSSFDDCKSILTPDGTYVTTRPSAKQVLEQIVTIFTKQKTESVMFSFERTDMDWLLKHAAEGRLRTVIDRTYSLHEIGMAHDYSEAGHAKGKLIVVP